MSCPYFYPVAPLEEDLWAVPPRLPLLEAYSGECHSAAEPHQPAGSVLRSVCNSGYPRGRCERFPPDAPSDAVRFHVTTVTSQLMRLQYVFEKNCRPVEFGELVYSQAQRRFSAPLAGAAAARQATAFIESYLRRAK